jgi:hypothetical protein
VAERAIAEGQRAVVNLFPDFDDNLRNAFQREIELFFASVVHEDRSVLDLLTADYTFVNERLAKQYGIPERLRSAVPPCDVPGRARHAPWVARQGCAPDGDVERGPHVARHARQVVPANLPRGQSAGSARRRARLQGEAADTTGNLKAPTMRQALEAHRINTTCASCHKIFEPMGLALENFDAVGSWRTQDEGQRIDASGVLPDGTAIDGITGLRSSLVRYSPSS